MDVKTFFYVFFYFDHVFNVFFNFPNGFFNLKNVGKVHSGKQIN